MQPGNAQQFLVHYEELVTAATRAAITRQSCKGLFADSRGVMIGGGQVWFSGICQDKHCNARTIRIIACNP